MELAQQGVDCVSGTGTKVKPDILKFSTTKQHQKINTVNIVCLITNQLSHVLDVLLRIIRHMSASIKHTLVHTVRSFGPLQSNCFVKKKKLKENQKKQNNVNLSDDNEKVAYTLYNVSSRSAPYKTNIIMDGKPMHDGRKDTTQTCRSYQLVLFISVKN